MAFEQPGGGPLDYAPCRYGASKLLFRGPKRDPGGRYCAALGGSETYGKYVRDPYPDLVEQAMGTRVVNFGCMNAGADVFLNEPAILDIVSRAGVTVIQVLGAHNMSNRFYTVHPRRNDRFLHASQVLRSLYREVDFTEFHFTRHMLLTLRRVSAARYALIEQELKAAWLARTRWLLRLVPGPSVLLDVGDHHGQGSTRDALGPAPLLVDPAMIETIRPFATELVQVRPSPAACDAGTEGMVHAPLDALAAAELPGPAVHAEIAQALVPVLMRLLK